MSGSMSTLVELATVRAKKASNAQKPIAQWTEEQKERFRELFKDSEPNCIVASRIMMDYGDNPNIDFNKLVTMGKIPYYKLMGFPLATALECEGDFLRNFAESKSYNTEEKRIQHFKEQWKFEGPFSCKVNRSYVKGCDCSTCPFHNNEEDYAPLKRYYGSVEEGIKDINRLHSHVTIGKDTYVIQLNKPSENGEPITIRKLSSFKDWYAHIVADTGKVDGDKKPILIPIAPAWLKSGDRVQYDGVGFYPHPAKPVPNHFNLFRGFRAERLQRVKGASCELYLDHIRNVICDGDEKLYQYVMAWLAHLIQKPGDEKPGTAIAIRGPQGCGKGTLTKWIQAVIGPCHSMKISSEDRLLGRFNCHLMDKLFINADECVWSGNRKIAGVLKALITESPLDFERKGIDPISLPSYLRIIFTSNESWMIPADADDRRFVVLDCGTSHVKDRPYYKALNDQMENGGAVELYHTLLEWDYSEVDIRQAPSTKALITQKLESLHNVDRWWYGVIYNASFDSIEYTEPDETTILSGWSDGPCFMFTSDMHNKYSDALKGSGQRATDSVGFGKRLRALTGLTPRKLTIAGRRGWGYSLPTVGECRRLFEKFMHTDSAMDWPIA